MKRKIVKIMVAVVTIGALLASCGSTETTIDKEIVENTEEEAEEATEEVAEEPVLEAVTIEETVLLDESGIKIIWSKTDIHFHGNKLHGDIKTDLIYGNGGILVHFSGNAVQETFL